MWHLKAKKKHWKLIHDNIKKNRLLRTTIHWICWFIIKIYKDAIFILIHQIEENSTSLPEFYCMISSIIISGIGSQ